MHLLFLILSILFANLPALAGASSPNGNEISGQILDSSGQPLSGAYIATNGHEFAVDEQGRFRILGGDSAPLLFKKAGYRKVLLNPRQGPMLVQLEPFQAKGIYVSTWTLKSRDRTAINRLVDLISRTELNAMVVDVKGDGGEVYQGLTPYIQEMHAKGIYMIARLVAFKDNIKPRLSPDLALIDARTGLPWEDKNHITYLNEYYQAAQQYLLDIAKQAAVEGFDEIQFDYVRFPTDGDRSSIRWETQSFDADSRTLAIATFLHDARVELGKLGVFVAADVFGDTADVPLASDSGIGQRIRDITPYLDYVCPMLYPSGYSAGMDGFPIPSDHPGELVEIELEKYGARAHPNTIIRPWLQAFPDYAFNKRLYGAQEIRAQIDAVASASATAQAKGTANTEGFLLWNAASHYSDAGLAP